MKFHTSVAVILTAAIAMPAAAQVRHYVFGLDPSGRYDIRQGGALVARDVAPAAEGQVVFDADGTASTVIVPTGTDGDWTAPAAVDDLAATGSTATSVSLRWTATGDDGATGQAAAYDLRYATSPIDGSNWGAAHAVPGVGAPHTAGTSETCTVSGLTAGTTYYFALDVIDDEGNHSGLSNVASRATAPPPDTTAPSAVGDLLGDEPTQSSIRLRWTSPGDDAGTGTATTYDVRYATVPITGGSWASASQATNEPSPREAGSSETFTVTGLTSGTTYYFAVKTADEVPNWSGLSNVTEARTSAPTDTIPPARIETLAVTAATATSLALSWTAPGDDGASGHAASYDLRYAISPIDGEAAWAAATQASGEPAPGDAGHVETFTLAGLQSSTTYFLAIRARDDATNVGALSNVVEATTSNPADTAPPASVTVTATSVGNRTASLQWIAPLDTGGASPTAASYEGRIRTGGGIRNETEWNAAAPISGLPAPQAPGTVETHALAGLAPGTSYTVAIRARDAAGNLAAIGVPASFTTTSAPDTLGPEPVDDLDVTGATTTSLTIGWSAPADRIPEDCLDTPDVDRYEIRFSTSPSIGADGWDAAIPVTPPDPLAPHTSQTLVVNALAPETIYYFAMRSRDPRGNWSAISNVPSGTTLPTEELPDNTPPGEIRDLTGAPLDPHAIRLAWRAPGGDGDQGRCDHYDLRRALTPIDGAQTWESATHVAYSGAPGAAGSVDTIVVRELEADRTHYFALRGFDAAGNAGPISSPIAVTTPAEPDTTPPDPVVDLAVAEADTASILLRWTAPADDRGGPCASYELRVSRAGIDERTWDADSLLPAPGAGAEPGSSVEHRVEGLPPGTRFAFALRCADGAGNVSALSNVAWGATDSLDAPPDDTTDATPPAAIDDLRAEPIDPTSIEITWTAVGDDGRTGTADRYELRQSSSAILDEEDWDSAAPLALAPAPGAPGSRERLSVTGLSPGTTLHFAVRAIDESGNRGSLSNDAGATTPERFDTSPPAAPIGMGTTIERTAVLARWEPAIEPDVTGYVLTRADVTNAGEPPLVVTGISGTAWRDTTLLPDVQYAYSVQARDRSGNLSAASRRSLVRVPLASFLPEVTGFSSRAAVEPDPTGNDEGTVVLTWTAVPGERCAAFAIDRSTDGGATWERVDRIDLASAPDGTFLWTETIAPGRYLYRIAAVSDKGYERAMPAIPVSWEPISAGMAVEGPFPNPCARALRMQVSVADAGRVVFRLHDIAGRSLGVIADEAVAAGSHTIEAPIDLPTGLYLLSIDAAGGTEVRKVVVRR